jgi:hypothetical protein
MIRFTSISTIPTIPLTSAVNEALRFLIRITKENQTLPTPKGDA